MALRYPDRAESLSDFERYRVFLDHWQPLVHELSTMRRALFARRESRTLGIYAPQGSGKTLFARRFAGDVEKSRNATEYDDENLWHRIAVDEFTTGERIVAPANNLKVLSRDAGHDDDWNLEIKNFVNHQNNRGIVLLDEADQAYMQLRLLGMDMQNFLQSSDPERLLKASAEKFVKFCRTELRGCLFVMLSNRREFLDNFAYHVNGQHHGMMSVKELPPADASTKEKVVRINTNRLNGFSYWYCINNATPGRKTAIFDSLAGAGTFPAAFEAVDAAVSDAVQTRMGRPAIKNHLTLCVLHEQPDYLPLLVSMGKPLTEFSAEEVSILLWTDDWASKIMPGTNQQSALMLESEWNLRIILLGPKMIGPLLSMLPDAQTLRDGFDVLFNVPSPYATQKTVDGILTSRNQAVQQIQAIKNIPTQKFWAAGQFRSVQYETELRKIYPNYNLGSTQVSGFRPDLILENYKECSVLQGGNRESKQITNNIRRGANFIEFTAVQAISKPNVVDYLAGKLKNYIRLMESA
ncbi:hypothetical protein [Variovorax sp. YR752]|uniref:hypothetical protein n=1 Tax=Variovorax sp. YR752 TaxID=1884383 RepID=UPI00313773E8